jgi:hypothetical protein
MVKQRIVRDAVKTGLVALIGIGAIVVNSESSFAHLLNFDIRAQLGAG